MIAATSPNACAWLRADAERLCQGADRVQPPRGGVLAGAAADARKPGCEMK